MKGSGRPERAERAGPESVSASDTAPDGRVRVGLRGIGRILFVIAVVRDPDDFVESSATHPPAITRGKIIAGQGDSFHTDEIRGHYRTVMSGGLVSLREDNDCVKRQTYRFACHRGARRHRRTPIPGGTLAQQHLRTRAHVGRDSDKLPESTSEVRYSAAKRCRARGLSAPAGRTGCGGKCSTPSRSPRSHPPRSRASESFPRSAPPW